MAQLAHTLVMERATLGHNLRPLARDRLLTIEVGRDKRARVVALTPAGKQKLKQCEEAWNRAQARLEDQFGKAQAAGMRCFAGWRRTTTV